MLSNYERTRGAFGRVVISMITMIANRESRGARERESWNVNLARDKRGIMPAVFPRAVEVLKLRGGD